MYLLGLVRCGAAENFLNVASRTSSVVKSRMTFEPAAGNNLASSGYGKEVIIIVGVPAPNTTEYVLGEERFLRASDAASSRMSLRLRIAPVNSSASLPQSTSGRSHISYAFVGRGSLVKGRGLTVGAGDGPETPGDPRFGDGLTIGEAIGGFAGDFVEPGLFNGFDGSTLGGGFAGLGIALTSTGQSSPRTPSVV